MITTEARNATLQDLAELLRKQQTRKLDVIAPAGKMFLSEGRLVLEGMEAHIDDDGVTPADGVYTCTDVFDEGLADKLNIPLPYVRRMRKDSPDLLDANVHGWLHGSPYLPYLGSTEQSGLSEDPRKFLLRLFKAEEGPGIARAWLSDKYRVIDNLDVLTAALAGVRASGVAVEPAACNLSERRMSILVWAPAVQVFAADLLKGYRSPFSGAEGDENPIVFAGFRIDNSENGNGAFRLTPEITVQVCTNGMTLTKEALVNVHLGGRNDEGVIKWSEDTRRKEIDLVTARAKDAAATFLDVDYVRAKINEMTELATKKVDPATVIQTVTKKLMFDQETTQGVLDFFLESRQFTAGGVMQAVTAYSQKIDSPDKAYSVQMQGVRAMELAASS